MNLLPKTLSKNHEFQNYFNGSKNFEVEKIKALVFEDISGMIEDLFEEARKEVGMSKKKFSEFLETENGQSLFRTFDDTTTDFFLARFTQKNFKSQLSILRQNATQITKQNNDLFRYFFAYVQTTHIVYGKLLDHLEQTTKGEDLEIRDVVNITLYGNLCRLADQIGILLTNGYPDGALMLWRSFYEYAVVAMFLMLHHSNDLATRFKDASFRDVKRKVESYTKRHTDLKFPPLHEKYIKDVDNEHQNIKSKYAKDFFDNDYSWAQGFLTGKPNFLNLESEADFGRFRPFYIWASGKCHPTYNELTSFKDSKENFVLRYVTTQEADKTSMVDPSQLTLGVFHQVNSHFLHLYSEDYEYDTNMMMFSKIYDRFSETIK